MTSYPWSVFDPNGLSDEQLHRHVPAIFASDAHESRSRRYTHIGTEGVLSLLRQEGFVPTMAMQALPRAEDRREFAKHIIRFRVPKTGLHVGDMFAEIELLNSSDGTSAYHLKQAALVLACLNGMTRFVEEAQRLHYRHSGRIVEEVVEGSLALAQNTEEMMDEVQQMKGKKISRGEQLLLAEFVGRARQGLTADEPMTIPPEAFLQPRRSADVGDDVWHVMNRVQENALRAGTRYLDTKGRVKRTRQIHGITQRGEINDLVWQFGARLAELRG